MTALSRPHEPTAEPTAEPHAELQRLRHALAQSQRALARAQADLVLARRAAHSDALTGLPNRLGFDRPSRRVLAEHDSGEQLLALLFVDLDGFKAVNDRLGHDAGDELLRVVGARLRHAMREGDLVCRHGGDEFVCLLPHLADAGRAAAIAEGLVRAIAAPCQIGPHPVRVTASIGLAMYPRDGSTVGALVRSADAAMYAAKSCGNRVSASRRLYATAPSGPIPRLTV
jgi:diguanylate cyclase (GGDEF)-like protein